MSRASILLIRRPKRAEKQYAAPRIDARQFPGHDHARGSITVRQLRCADSGRRAALARWPSTRFGGVTLPLGRRFGDFASESEDRALELGMDMSQSCLSVAKTAR